MYLRMAKRLLLETDKRLLWKLAWNMGWKGMLSVQKHKPRLQARRGLSAVPLRLDHQQLQPALPGLLGRRRRQAADDRARRHAQADRRSQGRWATSSSASSAASRSCTRSCSTCWPQHPDCYFQIFTNGQFITDDKAKRTAPARQRDAADQRRRHRDRQRRAPRPARTCSARRWKACRTA